MLQRLFGRGKAQPPPTAAPTPTAAPRIYPVDLTDADFAATITATTAAGPAVAVVDVWAEWCAPCRVMSAYVGMLAQEFAGRALVAAVDADENPAISEQFGIQGLPTLLFLHHGVEVDRIVGVVAYEEIKARLTRWLPSATGPDATGPDANLPDTTVPKPSPAK